MYDKDNVFARILRCELPATKVYEDDKILAFHDRFPVAPVHVVVVPKEEYVDYVEFINKASPEEIYHFFKKISEIADKLGLSVDGYRLITNKGIRSGQSIFHFHMHIIGGSKLEGLIG